MAILTDAKLKDAINKGEIQITPAPKNLEPASIDLTVGDEAFITGGDKIIKLSEGKSLILPSGEMALVVTKEGLKLSSKIVGHFGLKSSFARKGLVLLAGLQIDPGFEGTLHVVLYNLSSEEISLAHGELFCSVEFHELSEGVETPYSGAYQGQKSISLQEIIDIRRRRGLALGEVNKNMQAVIQDIGTLAESVIKLKNRTDRYMMIFILILAALVIGVIITMFALS